MFIDFVGRKGEGKVGAKAVRFVMRFFHVGRVNGDVICGKGFLLPVQKLEKRKVVSISEFGIINFCTIHDVRFSVEKLLDSLSN